MLHCRRYDTPPSRHSIMAAPQTAAPIVLRKRSLKNDLNTAAVMVLVAVFMVTAVAIFLVGRGQGIDPETLWETLQRKLAKDPFDTLLHAVGLLALVGFAVYTYLTRHARRAARLTLGPEGIDYVFPAPEWIPYVTRKWFIPWGKLKPLDLNTTHAVLTLSDGNHRRALRILEWVTVDAADAPTPKGFFGAKVPITLKARRALIDESPLMRALHERGLVPASSANAVDYDLFSSPEIRIVLIAMAVLAGYALIDGMLLEETYPDEPPYPWLAVAGVLSAMGMVLLLFLKKVPMLVALVVGLLAAVVIMFAGYPGLLRVNQLTDANGLQSYEYELRSQVRFHPLQDGLPVIELRAHPLWGQQRIGSRHRFELRRGGLGFYQLNMAPIRQAQGMYQEGYRSTYPTKPAP